MSIKIEEYDLRKLDKDTESRIHNFILKCPYSTIFHTLDWLRVITTSTEKECKLLLSVEDDKIVGFLPYFTLRNSILHKVFVSSLDETRYAGPIYSKGYEKAGNLLIEKILSFSHNLYYLYSAPNIDATIFRNKDFRMEERKTAVLDVSRPIDEIYKNIKRRTRQAIKKAQKSEIKIVDGKLDDLSIYHKMLTETYVRSEGVAPFEKLIENSIKILAPIGNLKFTLAILDKEPIAGLLTLYFQDKVYYWGGAVFNDYRKLQPNSLLFWDLIQKISGKYQSLDFLGIDDLRLSRFKMSWGCKESIHYYCSKKTGLLYYLSKLKHRNR